MKCDALDFERQTANNYIFNPRRIQRKIIDRTCSLTSLLLCKLSIDFKLDSLEMGWN